MSRFFKYQISFKGFLLLGFSLISSFQLINYVKAEIFQPDQFRIIVYGYPDDSHNNKKEMKTAKVYLETQNGEPIKFCPEGKGRYIKCKNGTTELDIDKTQPFKIQISHLDYEDREINFLSYPFKNKGSAFTFYLFQAKNYQINSAYNDKGANLFCNRQGCNSIIDQAVSYYELAERSLSSLSDSTTKKEIIYNLARAKFDAWNILNYDTCYQAHQYYSEAINLLQVTKNQTEKDLRSYLVTAGYMDQNGKNIMKNKESFCKK